MTRLRCTAVPCDGRLEVLRDATLTPVAGRQRCARVVLRLDGTGLRSLE
jgi:hypothetical protein